MVSVTQVPVAINTLMHAQSIIKQSLAYVMGSAAFAEEATPKPGAKKPITKEMHEAENAQGRNNWGGGKRNYYSYR